MAEFSKEELEAARKAISSSIRKIEKVKEPLSEKQPPPKSQLTLASRNLQAMRIAMSLINRELKENEEKEA